MDWHRRGFVGDVVSDLKDTMTIELTHKGGFQWIFHRCIYIIEWQAANESGRVPGDLINMHTYRTNWNKIKNLSNGDRIPDNRIVILWWFKWMSLWSSCYDHEALPINFVCRKISTVIVGYPSDCESEVIKCAPVVKHKLECRCINYTEFWLLRLHPRNFLFFANLKLTCHLCNLQFLRWSVISYCICYLNVKI